MGQEAGETGREMQSPEDAAAEIRRLRDFAELASDWFWEQDADLRFTGFDGVSIEKLRRRQSGFIGKRRWEMPIRCADPEQLAAHIAACERHEAFKNFIYEIPADSGDTQYYAISGTPVFDERGTFTGYHGVGRNITELKLAEQGLIESERLLAQIIDGSSVPAFVIDAQHRVTHWNRACAFVTGVPASQVVGRAEAWRGFYPAPRPTMADLVVDGATEADLERYYAGKFARSQTVEGAYEAEDFFPHMSGGRWLFFSAAPLYDSEGRLAGAIDILQDVTARKLAEQAERGHWKELQQTHMELKQAMQQLVEAEKLASLGRLVAGISHELNTPLGNALVVATALQEMVDGLAEECRAQTLKRSILDSFSKAAGEASAMLTSNINRAAKLVERFRQISSEQTSEHPQAFLLQRVLTDVLETLRGSLDSAGITVEVAVPPGLLLESYPGALEQILFNLFENAMVHGFEGRTGGLISITAELREGMAVIDFADNGCGMTEEVRKHAFDPFYTTHLGQGGSGLGLYLVHNLATGTLGGHVELHDRKEGGITLHMTLPQRVGPLRAKN
ncbi:MAG: Histidine kinase [Pseudomonadota bacterium]|nr:Histidine kinase [Pseudomonadota bacterium]